MFSITERANNEFKTILSGADMPKKAGVRVFSQSGSCCTPHTLGVEVIDLSDVKNQVLDYNGLSVLIDDEVSEVAENATIDFYDHPENPGFRVLWRENNIVDGGCCCGH